MQILMDYLFRKKKNNNLKKNKMETVKNNFEMPKIPVIDKDDNDCTTHEENEPDKDWWYPFLSWEEWVEYEINRLMEKD